MLDPAIVTFFSERKEAWLKKNLKAQMDEKEKIQKQRECEETFSLKNWLPNAAKRAGQMSISTHPCTFSHPSARKNKKDYVTSVIASSERKNDGFLRSGNVQVEPDALGNAAALDVHKFLMLEMSDQKKLLTHIQEESNLARELLGVEESQYVELRDGFLKMIASDSSAITSSKIKQVYFPLNFSGDYHQLSLLTNSASLFELRERIDKIRFSEDYKEARLLKKDNKYSSNGFREIYGITTIGYGGTKPQNISVLNNQNAGKAHLLLSMPPKLVSRSVRMPKQNFFTETLSPWHVKEIFYTFSRFLNMSIKNVVVRENRDKFVIEYLDYVIEKMWQVRSLFQQQNYNPPHYLPSHQAIWLLPDREQEREETDEWLDKLVLEIAQNFVRSYEKVAGKQVIKLGDAEFQEFFKVIEQEKEVLR